MKIQVLRKEQTKMKKIPYGELHELSIIKDYYKFCNMSWDTDSTTRPTHTKMITLPLEHRKNIKVSVK